MYIYKITHKESGKSYVGQTTKAVSTRFKAHCNKNSQCPLIRNAIQEFGVDAFSLDTLAICKTKEELNKAEQYYIEVFNSTYPNGYNLSDGKKRVRYKSPKEEEFDKKLKDLANLIKFCRKNGITSLKLNPATNGVVEFTLAPEKPLSNYKKKKLAVTGELSTGDNDPLAKMPSDSDLLMWSSPAYDLITETRKETEPRGS